MYILSKTQEFDKAVVETSKHRGTMHILEDVQYLKNIVSYMIKSDGYTVKCKYFVRRFTDIKIDWHIEKENDFSVIDTAKEKWRRIPEVRRKAIVENSYCRQCNSIVTMICY